MHAGRAQFGKHFDQVTCSTSISCKLFQICVENLSKRPLGPSRSLCRGTTTCSEVSKQNLPTNEGDNREV
eukprot:5503873-Amphidinium_carterae.1